MKKSPIDREALAGLLDKFGDSLASFDALRPDSYEHALACQSLERLEHFYAQIMQPGETQDDARRNCPPWPEGTKFAGQLPSTKIISIVSERLRTNAALKQVRPIGTFLKELRKEIKGTALGDNQMILDGMLGAIGQKLMQDVRDGKPISENLKMVQALQNQRVIEQNETKLKQNEVRLSQNDRRITLLESKIKSASDEVKKMREKGNAITDEERNAILNKVDEILGIK